jgi:hypothetical protein
MEESKMKNVAIGVLVVAMLVVSVFTPVFAEDVVLNAKAARVMTGKIDKNGNPFAIIFIQEERTLSGVAYVAEAPLFAMGPSKDEASKVQEGETFKAIVSKRSVNGDVTYTLRKVIK